MTPEQLREHAKQWDDDGRYSIGEVFRAHAAALEELARVKVERDNERKITSHTYDLVLARAERTESALAESERKCERLKFHAEAMAETLDKWAAIDQCKCSSVDAYRAEFKEDKP